MYKRYWDKMSYLNHVGLIISIVNNDNQQFPSNLHVFLFFSLSEVEFRQENISKTTTWEQKSTKTKAENKQWTGPLSTFLMFLYGKIKRRHKTSRPPFSILLVKPLAFGK